MPEPARQGAERAAVGADGRPGAPQARLLARLGETLAEAGRICQELAEVQLAESGVPRLLEGMSPPPAPSGPRPGKLLSVADLARRLGVRPRTVRRWREAGKLPPAVEVGGVVRWRPEDVERWIEKGGTP